MRNRNTEPELGIKRGIEDKTRNWKKYEREECLCCMLLRGADTAKIQSELFCKMIKKIEKRTLMEKTDTLFMEKADTKHL